MMFLAVYYDCGRTDGVHVLAAEGESSMDPRPSVLAGESKMLKISVKLEMIINAIMKDVNLIHLQ